jgi:diacylglycerol kinase (ATP)
VNEVRLALIVNPQAGKGHAARVGVEAENALRAAGAEVTRLAGSTADETRALAQRAVRTDPDGIVVVGGDGTLTGIIDVLAESGHPITLVPAGTGNDLARALGIPTDDPQTAALAALGGSARTIDLGTIESQGAERVFLTVAALGFDATVSERTNALRRPSGRLRYYLAVIVELVRLRPMVFRISLDGRDERVLPGTLLAVGNTRSYGGGMPICADALADDGRLDVVHVAPLTRARLIRLFPLLLRGSHLQRPEVRHLQARSVRVSAPDLVVYADGERVGAGECTIGVRPAAVTVMTPRE